MDKDRYVKDVTGLGITALCLSQFDAWGGDVYEPLQEGQTYKVTQILMKSDYCYVWLEGYPNPCNSVCFSFLKEGVPHDIYRDEECRTEWMNNLLKRKRREYDTNDKGEMD